MAFQVIVVLVIAIAFALIYFFWLRDYREFGENLSDYQICKSSNFENAKLKLNIDNFAIQERSGNKCKTEYLKVPKDQELNFIARKLAGCWDQYLEGRETLFATKDNNYCAMCSVLTFDDKKELKTLTSYLMDNTAPGTGGKKYYKYLNRITVKEEIVKEVENEELLGKIASISTDVPLAVIFVEGKDINPGSLTGASSIESGTLFGVIGAVVIGVAAGAAVIGGAISCPFTFGGGCFLAVATIGGIGGAVGGGTIGYLSGSDLNPDVDERVLLWRYTNDDLKKLKCTILEGQDSLEIRK